MKAIHKGPHGEVLVDQQKCIGCKMCLNACPYGVPVFNMTRSRATTAIRPRWFSVRLFHTRNVRQARPNTAPCAFTALERGELPACVAACGIHAMTLVDYDNPTPEMQKLIDAARPLNEAAGTKPKIRYIAKHMKPAEMAVKLG